MPIETETDFATLAAWDAESREIDFDALPTRAEVEQTGKPAFTVTDESSANWVLRKLAAIESEQNRVKAQAAARIAELTADRERLMSRFGADLEAFARAEAERRRRKTVTLMEGTLTLRTVPARFIVSNAEEAFAHARTAFPDLIVTASPSLDTSAYLKAATETGEQLPGLDLQPAKEAFGVKFMASAKYGVE